MHQDFAVAVTIIATVVCYFTVFVFESSKATTQLGLVCNFFTIIFFAAPLATMVTTLATHETRTPPLISTLVLCMTPAIKLMYKATSPLPPRSLFPLPPQVEVVRNKSTETMSFPLTVMSLLTTASWATYGTLIHDIYVQVSVLCL